MSKQDTVVPGLRVHLHQHGFTWSFDGVLILAGLKIAVDVKVRTYGFGGVLILGELRLPFLLFDGVGK